MSMNTSPIEGLPRLDAQVYQVEVTADGVELPNGVNYNAGAVVNLDVDQFMTIASTSIPDFVKVRGAFSPLDGVVAPFYDPDVTADMLYIPVDLAGIPEEDGAEVARVTLPANRGPSDVVDSAIPSVVFGIGLGPFSGDEASVDLTFYAQEWDPATEVLGDEAQIGGSATMVVTEADQLEAALGYQLSSSILAAFSTSRIKPGTDLVVRASDLTPFTSGTLLIIATVAYVNTLG